MLTPEVSVCIPVMAEEPVLVECVQAVLNQSFKDFELLLVLDERTYNNGDIKQLAKLDSRVKIVEAAPFKTASSALNICIAQAKGEFIKFVWQSDILQERCLERFVQAFRSNRSLTLASCAYEIELSGGAKAGLWRNKYPCEIIPGRDLVKTQLWQVTDFVGNLSATFFRRDYGLSGFDERYFNLGELDFWLRLAAQGDYLYLDQALCTARTPQNYSGQSLETEALLACHDYILLADNFAQFMGSEQVEACAFIDANRSAMEGEFRRRFGHQDISELGHKRVAAALAQSLKNSKEQSFALECYLRLSYELLRCYGNVRSVVMHYRDQVATLTRLAEEQQEEHSTNMTFMVDSKDEELAKLQAKYSEVCHERDRMLSSSTWRFTEPIRFLYALIRKCFKKTQHLLLVDNA